jgi:hypothetical protein
MNEMWTLSAKLRSGVLLVGESHDLNLSGQPQDGTEIHFARPKLVENASWPNWNHGIPWPTWDYDVSIRFSAKDENDAQEKSWRKLESIAARLSFLGSAPVTVESYGSVTNAPESLVKGTQYTTISFTLEQAWEGRKPPVISEADAKYLPDILVPEAIAKSGMERINRSMRWLQHSHFAPTPADEFMCLMLAFEAVSHLLKVPKPNYWHCQTCNQDITACPNCGASTEWAGSGNIAMRDFVCDKLGWTTDEWKQVWKLRNSIFHGTHDLSAEQQQITTSYLGKLEEAVVSALKYLLNLPREAPPQALRQRNKFYGAKLRVKWTSNQ